MTLKFSSPWHKASFDRFVTERLPRLLAERLPLAGYLVTDDSPHTVNIHIELAASDQTVAADYPALPRPDDDGVFTINGQPHVVVPTASREELDQAEIQCAGEMLYNLLERSVQLYNGELDWNEDLLRTLLPLDTIIRSFLRDKAQPLDTTNWNSRTTHLRRIVIPNRTKVVAEGQMGRVDPFETPEGPNIGYAFTVALGAAIEGEKLVIHDDSVVGKLGHNSAMVPFLGHGDANRLLMGVNMMRQAIPPSEPEPALVQTGYEAPGAPVWNGYNLLTAFVAWGEGSVEDGLVISESCARRMNTPYPAEIGDKLANRHGTKGVVAQVLPDDQMPHLPDGTPVEICFSFTGLYARLNPSQVLEAVAGRIAKAEGGSIMAPPFAGPSHAELQARLAKNGLDESGMVRLTDGKNGRPLEMDSTVGWLYWYRLEHLSRPKIKVAGQDWASDPFTELHLSALLKSRAVENAREALRARSCRWAEGEPGTPFFRELAARLAPAGIAAEVGEHGLRLRFEPEGQNKRFLVLAGRVRHPWLPSHKIDRAGTPPEEAGQAARKAYIALENANNQLNRWIQTLRPVDVMDESLLARSRESPYFSTLFAQFEQRLAAYFDALLPAQAMQVYEPQCWWGRAVAAPGIGLSFDQAGLPAAIMEGLFGKDGPAPEDWVVIVRPPMIPGTSLAAFHPVLTDGPAILLSPQATQLIDTDFDGDQVAVFRPLSAKAQREAGKKLSVAAQVRSDPSLAGTLLKTHEAVWGLAWRSLTEDGRVEIAGLLGIDPQAIITPLAQPALEQYAQALVAREGVEAALPRIDALARLGYTAAKASGASLSPFATAALDLPPQPESDHWAEWEPYLEMVAEQIFAMRDYTNAVLGPQLLSAAVRPNRRQVLPFFLGPRMFPGNEKPIRHGNLDGLTADELFSTVPGARTALARISQQGEQILQDPFRNSDVTSVSLLARARRSRRPGIVFARAAENGEVDPLADAESRVLVGK